MKIHLAAIAAAMSFACVSACAQTAPAVEPARAAAARELLDASRTRELMTLSLQQAEQQFPAQMEALMKQAADSDTTRSAEEKAQARELMLKTMPAVSAKLHQLLSDPKLVDEMMAEIVPLYAQTYSLDELRKLSAFYRSPIGQKVLANTPKLMSATGEISNRIMLPRLQQLMTEMVGQMTPK